jgi:hypothetical protein
MTVELTCKIGLVLQAKGMEYIFLLIPETLFKFCEDKS